MLINALNEYICEMKHKSRYVVGATTENPRVDMINAVEKVRNFVANFISSLGGKKESREQRSLTKDCFWLNAKLHEFTMIALDTTRRHEIVELATTITSAKIDSCTAEEVGELERKKSELDEIWMDLISPFQKKQNLT